MDKRLFLLSLSFLSGFAALLYEIIWFRKAHLIFGVSYYALSTVVITFFLGIAIGSFVGGRLADYFHSDRKNLKFYGFIEAGIAVFSLLVPLGLLISGYFLSLFYSPDVSLWAFNFIRFILSSVVFLVPAIFIGMTFPVVLRIYVDKRSQLRKGVSLLYFANTIGGVLGVVLTGFIFIRYFGIQNSLYLGVLINVLIAISVFVMGKMYSSEIKEDYLNSEESKAGIFVFLSFASGFIAISLEILWGKLFVLYFFGTIYAASVLLGMFLFGLAAGSFVYAKYLKGASLKTFGYLQIIAAVFVMIGFSFFVNFNPSAEGFGASVFQLVIASLVIVFIPATLFGISFPLVIDSFVKNRRKIGNSTGKVYAANTIGGISGAFVAGFFMIPLIGLRNSMLLFSFLGLILGLFVLLKRDSRKGVIYFVVGLLVVLLLGLNSPSLVGIGDLKEEVRVVYNEPGLTGIVSVLEDKQAEDSYYRLYVDNQEVAATTPVLSLDSKVLAHLPLILHGNASNALTIGYGSGGTSYSMLLHDIEVDAVEIEEKVIEASEYFKDLNQGVVGHDNLSIIIEDARFYLRATDKKYDVISTDVTNIRYKSNSNLYTKEYFELMKSSLNRGGIATAWVPVSDISEEDQKILMKTFNEVFPETTVWYFYNKLSPFFIYLGTDGLAIDYSKISDGFNDVEIAADLEEVGVNEINFINSLFMDARLVKEYVGNAGIHTDNNPVLEFPDFIVNEDSYSFSDNLRGVLSRKVDVREYIYGFGSEEEGIRVFEEIEYENINVARYLVEGHVAIAEGRYDEAARFYAEAVKNADYLDRVDL